MKREDHNISILIRTRDLENLLPNLLRKLSVQTVQPNEVVIVDNYSSETSFGKMKSFLEEAKGVVFQNRVSLKLVPIADRDFSHPYSTNLGVGVASGDFVCILNGHSIPTSNSWVEFGVSHFSDPKVAGVAGYFTAHRNGTFWEKLFYDWWWKKRKEISNACSKDDYFSTVNCILRRSLWVQYPFDERLPVDIPETRWFGGEDFDWAEEMQARGYEIVVDPRFNVSHSHGDTLAQLVPKYVAWRQIRRRIESYSRPRQSHTRVKAIGSFSYNI
jgi:GT2 family glycosyltransferase